MSTIYTPQRMARLNEDYRAAIARAADAMTRRAHLRMCVDAPPAQPQPLGKLTAATVQTDNRNARRVLAHI